MEEIEVPTEHLHEAMHHEAHHSQERWITAVALSTALLAALAAVAALLSGYHANKAVIDHIKANDQWSYYQAKNEKATIIQGKIDLLKAFDKTPAKADIEKVKDEKDKMADLQVKAKKFEVESDEHFERHEMLARSVTLFQVAIAICAISVLTKRQWFWGMGLAFGAAATGFLIYGFVFTPTEEAAEGSAEQQKEPKEKGKETKDSKEPKSEKEAKERKSQSESGASAVAPRAGQPAANAVTRRATESIAANQITADRGAWLTSSRANRPTGASGTIPLSTFRPSLVPCPLSLVPA